MASLAAYTYLPEKPSLDIYLEDLPALRPAIFESVELTLINYQLAQLVRLNYLKFSKCWW
jgi:hypothetical protein